MYGASYYGGFGDTLNVTGALTNSAGATLTLPDNSSDVANVGTLTNLGSLYVGIGTTLNLTNQSGGITDVPMGSSLTVNGTVMAGSANALAGLTTVEGSLSLGNGQMLSVTPVGTTTLTVSPSGAISLSNPGTSLTLNGALNHSGSLTVTGNAVTITSTATFNAGSSVSLAGGSTLTVNGALTNNSINFTTGLSGAGGNTVNVAVQARRCGLASSWLGCLGRDMLGDLVHRSLIAEGVDVSHVRRLQGPNPWSRIRHHGADRIFDGSNPGVRSQYNLGPGDDAFIAAHDLVHTSVHSDLDAELPRLRAHAGQLSYDYSEHFERPGAAATMRYVDIAFVSAPRRSSGSE
jgi:hypothetical protein